jgi:gluconate 2-dehydrogenase gamma chain
VAGLGGCRGQSPSPWRFFTEEEGRTLSFACERIVPTDQDPGAAWAGAVEFIDRQLPRSYRRFQKTYRDGLAALDQTSQASFTARFYELNEAQQIEVLQAVEKGQPAGELWKKVSPREFFNTLVNHTMQAYYGDPRHGGNRQWVSWKMLRVPQPPVRGRQHLDLTQLSGRQPS